MQRIKSVEIVETVAELRTLQRKFPSKFQSIQMLILLRQQGDMSKYKVAALLGSSHSSVGKWRNRYKNEGMAGLLQEKRGGKKPGAITAAVHLKLAARLNDPKGGFRSFIEIQQWLKKQFGIDMGYHAVNKYVKRKFGARLKVSRKSHVLKDPAAEAVFKKPV